jgi:hypothetical protein
MRRYDIVFGILLILSIIDLALAAPLLVQEKRHACVDVVQIPKDVITVLGKRGEEDLEKSAKLAEEYFEKWGNPVESSDAHASPSSAPPGPDHGSMNDAQAPAPNPNPNSNPASPKESGQAHENQVEHVQQSSSLAGSWTDSYASADSSDSDDNLVSHDLQPPKRLKPAS